MMRSAILLLVAATFGWSAELSADRQAAFDRLTTQLVAPCCWTEAAATHRSPAAREVQATVRSRLLAGRSEEEILDEMVGRYGERILIVPEGDKATWLFWAPIVVLALGGAGAAWKVRRLLQRPVRTTAQSGPLAEVDDDELDW